MNPATKTKEHERLRAVVAKCGCQGNDDVEAIIRFIDQGKDIVEQALDGHPHARGMMESWAHRATTLVNDFDSGEVLDG